MSIEDGEGREIIRLGNIHAAAFKGAIYFAPIFAIWIVTKVLSHDTEIAVLKSQIAYGDKRGVSQSVNVGKTDEAATQLIQGSPHRDYLTTAEVAAKENVSVREVVDMIATGEIVPLPQKEGREYRIAADYRRLRHPAADCGEQPQ